MSNAMTNWAGRLHRGLFPAVPVTFRADGSIDWAAQERYIEWMWQQPVTGTAVWAHTGRGLFLNRADRQRVMSAWTAGDKPVVAGVGAPTGDDHDADRYQHETMVMAEDALTCGADYLMMYAPVMYRGRDDQDERVLRHVQALASFDAPLVLFYLYEAAGGISYSLDLLDQMFAVPQVVGIKMATLDSVMTYQDVAWLIKERYGEKVLITGEDRFLGYSLMAGATSALIGMAAACTKPQAKLLEHYIDGSMTEFVQLNQFVDWFAKATFCAPMEGYIQRLLWCLVADGVIPAESAFDPFGPALGDHEHDVVMRGMRAILGAC